MGQVTIISGNVRRRSWSDEEKREFVMRAFAPGATVSQVAADADIHTSLLFRWRRELRGNVARPDGGFAQVVMTPDTPARTDRSAIQIRLGNASIDIAEHASPALVTATLKALAR